MSMNCSAGRVQEAHHHGTRAVWLCYGGMMSLAVAVNVAPIYLTTFSDAFGGPGRLTDEQLGRIPAVMFAALVAGVLSSGPLADRWGAKWFAVAALALIGAGLGLLAAAWNYAALLVAIAVMGLGSGVMDMVLSPIVCALRPERRAAAMNWLHSFYCTGAVCTVLIGSCALHFGVPWRAVAAGFITLPAALLIAFLPLRLPPLVHVEAVRDPLGALIQRPLFLAALAAIMLSGATEVGLAQWLPAYAERGLGYTKAAGGLALGAFSVAMVVARFSAGTLGHLIRPIPLMLTCCAASAGLYVVGCFSPYPAPALAACIAIGFTSSCLWPTMLGVTADRFPHGGASMFGLMTASGNMGCFIMPWVVGVASGQTALNYGIATAGLCPILLAAILLWMAPRHDEAPAHVRVAPETDAP